MSTLRQDRLFNLLPAIYRIRDHEHELQLRTLLGVIEEELYRVEDDISDLYADWFIETCAEWLISYIGDLLGVGGQYAIESNGVFSQRAYVANTLRYRRRKGTLAMLEDLAQDVTGWPAHTVEFFERLGWTQNLNHLRFEEAANPDARYPAAVDRVGTVNLRSLDVVDRLDGPFDRLTHTVDIRPFGQRWGRHNIRKIGFFLWRLRHYPLERVRARRSTTQTHGFFFSHLGNPAPLFNNPQHLDRTQGQAQEIHVPGPIRPLAFHHDPAAYYGVGLSIQIVRDDVLVPVEDLLCKDLSTWDPPPLGRVAVDVARGRLAFNPAEVPGVVLVDYTYAFSADIGGGPYDRRAALVRADEIELFITVAKAGTVDASTLQQAVQQWIDAGQPPCVIEIQDGQVYGGNLDIPLPEGGSLTLQAAENQRPCLRTVGISSMAPAGGARLRFNGLLIEGGFELNGALDVTLEHCTLVPGRRLTEEGEPANPDRDSLVVGTPSPDLLVTLRKCICGPIRLPASTELLTVEDSIIQAPPVGGVPRPAIAAADAGGLPGPRTVLRRVTCWGAVLVRELEASEVLFNDPVQTLRRQEGCIRFSYVPPGSATPRRYRCQPDLALAQEAKARGLDGVADLPASDVARVQAQLRPEFTSERFGDPGFAQLSLRTDQAIHTGAEDGSEIGAFSALQQPQRTTNLRARLDEYLPFGLDAGFIFAT